jgi:hypothetical protein
MSKFIIALIVSIAYSSVMSLAADLPADFPIDVKKFIWEKPENLTDPEWYTTPIYVYHFHVYFFQDNQNSKKQAIKLR